MSENANTTEEHKITEAEYMRELHRLDEAIQQASDAYNKYKADHKYIEEEAERRLFTHFEEGVKKAIETKSAINIAWDTAGSFFIPEKIDRADTDQIVVRGTFIGIDGANIRIIQNECVSLYIHYLPADADGYPAVLTPKELWALIDKQRTLLEAALPPRE